MLRTNSKKVRQAVKDYIMEDLDYIQDYEEYQNISTWDEVKKAVKEIFYSEYGWRVRHMGEFDSFKSWAQGLALGGLFIYYYNTPAVDLVGDWLKQTAEERMKYSEEKAEELATKLIYREIFG